MMWRRRGAWFLRLAVAVGILALVIRAAPVGAGLWIREGAIMVLLGTEGVGEVPAVALGTLVFATTVLAPGLVGGVREGLRLMRAEG